MTWIRPAVFGAADGLTCAVGVILSLHHAQALVFPAAVGVAVAETVGMAGGEWLSESDSGFAAATVIGVATGIGGIAPAVPYAFTTGPAALAVSAAVVIVLAAAIAAVRARTRGVWRAVAETFGILAAVFAAVFASSLITPGGAT